MTETTFPFASVREEHAPQPEPQPDRRPLAVVLGGGLLAVALVGGAVFAFTGAEELPIEATVTSAAGAPGAAAPAPAEQAQTVPVANTESIARNPFEPKYVEPAPVVEAPAPAPAEAVLPVPTPLVVLDPQGGLVTVPTVPAPVPEQPAPPAPAPAPREYRLVLTGVSTSDEAPLAEFTIDGAIFRVKATEIFGPHGQLLLRSLQQDPKDGQWTATIQVGDARPLDVKTGEAVYVQ